MELIPTVRRMRAALASVLVQAEAPDLALVQIPAPGGGLYFFASLRAFRSQQ